MTDTSLEAKQKLIDGFAAMTMQNSLNKSVFDEIERRLENIHKAMTIDPRSRGGLETQGAAIDDQIAGNEVLRKAWRAFSARLVIELALRQSQDELARYFHKLALARKDRIEDRGGTSSYTKTDEDIAATANVGYAAHGMITRGMEELASIERMSDPDLGAWLAGAAKHAEQQAKVLADAWLAGAAKYAEQQAAAELAANKFPGFELVSVSDVGDGVGVAVLEGVSSLKDVESLLRSLGLRYK